MGMRTSIVFLAFWTFLAPDLCAQEVPSRIEKYLNAQVAENGFSGKVLIARGDEVLISKSFGLAPAAGEASGQSQNRFPIGSVTEQFLGAAILQLEGAGKVRLDNPICEYIANCPTDWKPIHVLHLLTHSSGLPSVGSIASCDEHSSRQLTLPELLGRVPRKSLLFTPGDRFNDNRFDYLLLCLVIERVSGQSIKDYLEAHIFLPLKLTQTSELDPAPKQSAAGTKRQDGCLEGELASKGFSFILTDEVYSTTDDLYRWNLSLTPEKFLPKNALEQMFTPYVEGHGIGWKIIKEFDRKLALQNNGLEPTSLSIRRYPDDQTCIIVVSHTSTIPASTLSRDLGAFLFGKNYPVSPNPPALHPPRGA